MTLVDRFLKYVSFDTQSDESTGLTPSTPKQMIFAEYLKKELESLRKFPIPIRRHAAESVAVGDTKGFPF